MVHGSTFCCTAVGDSRLSSFRVQPLSLASKALDFSSLLALYPCLEFPCSVVPSTMQLSPLGCLTSALLLSQNAFHLPF